MRDLSSGASARLVEAVPVHLDALPVWPNHVPFVLVMGGRVGARAGAQATQTCTLDRKAVEYGLAVTPTNGVAAATSQSTASIAATGRDGTVTSQEVDTIQPQRLPVVNRRAAKARIATGALMPAPKKSRDLWVLHHSRLVPSRFGSWPPKRTRSTIRP